MNNSPFGSGPGGNSFLFGDDSLSDLPTYLPNTSSGDAFPAIENKTLIENSLITSEVTTRDSDDDDADAEEGSKVFNGFIPGTTISLQTDEDIAKWIEERKKRWPTDKRIEEKKLAEKPQKRPNNDAASPPAKKQKAICRFYQQNKRCKFGNKCKNLHEAASSSTSTSSAGSTKMINGVPVLIPKRFTNELYLKEKDGANGSSLYKMLVQKDLYEHENEAVLDFIQYLDEHNLIDHDVSI